MAGVLYFSHNEFSSYTGFSYAKQTEATHNYTSAALNRHPSAGSSIFNPATAINWLKDSGPSSPLLFSIKIRHQEQLQCKHMYGTLFMQIMGVVLIGNIRVRALWKRLVSTNPAHATSAGVAPQGSPVILGFLQAL